MGKSSSQKASEAADLQMQQQQIQLQQQQAALAKQYAQQQQQMFQQIQPIAQGGIAIGQQALAGQAPSAFTAQPLTQLAQGSQQNRQNLMDFFGQSGQIAGSGANSGILAGPMANIGNQQALGAAQINQNAILQGLQTGFQGAGLLTGQQQIFNPFSAAGAASQAGSVANLNPQQFANPWVGALGGALGGLGAAAGGALANPNVKL